MIVFVVIGILLLIFAFVNWGQSEDLFHRILRRLTKNMDLEDNSSQQLETGNGKVSVNDNDDLEVYASDDDSDYVDSPLESN